MLSKVRFFFIKKNYFIFLKVFCYLNNCLSLGEIKKNNHHHVINTQPNPGRRGNDRNSSERKAQMVSHHQSIR